MNNKIKKEKSHFKKIVDNNIFVLRYAFSLDNKLILIKFISDIIVNVGNTLFSTLMIKSVIDAIMGNKTFHEMMIIILVGIIANTFLRIFYECTVHYFDMKFAYLVGKIQRIFIEKAARIDLVCYDNPKYFDDFVLAASQSDEMIGMCVNSTSSLISFSLSILAVGGIIFTINPIIAIFPIAGFFVDLIMKYKILKVGYEWDTEVKTIWRKADYSKRVFYQPEYAKEIKLSEISTPLQNQLHESIGELSQIAKKYGIINMIYSLINSITTGTVLSFFCLPGFLGYLSIYKKEIGLGDVASMNTAAGIVQGNLSALNWTLESVQRVGLYTERFRKFMEYEVRIEDTKGTKDMPKELSTIEIKNMSFKYEGSESYALKNINITINPKEKIAIVGHNGAGKTTFVKLLMRLYDVTEGEITYGGINIKDLPIKEYRNNVGIVFQDFQIYGSSISENVLMDVYNEEKEDLVKSSLVKADFAKKLESLSKGIDTELTREFSDDGTTLSGGESQKVAIARMFAKPIKVAILDEPSSALDPMAEAKLNESMIKNAEESSIIFISHRLSTARIADKVYMFENGEVIEQGTHNELIELGGEYEKMFEKQAHNYVTE